MKNNKYILLSLSLFAFILIWIFSYNSFKNIQAKKIAFEQKMQEEESRRLEEEKLNQEISEKLNNLEVSPTLNIESEEEFSSSDSSTWTITSSGNTSKMSEIELKKRKEKVLILTFSSVEQCESLVYLKEECNQKFIFTLATDEGDLKYCDKISDETEKNDCKDAIYYDKNNCKSIKNTFLRSKCEANVLESQESISSQKIISSSSKESDIDKCNSFETFYEKQSCLKNIILNTSNIGLCKSFYSDVEDQTNCTKNVAYDYNRKVINEAFTKKDLSICDKLLDESSKKQCKSMTF